MEKVKVKVVFPAAEKNRPTWPYINYDVEKRAKEVISILEKQLSEIEFSHQVIYEKEKEKVEKIMKEEKYDGYLVYMTSMWTGRPGYVSDPVIDTGTNQIIYAHCVATDKVYGPDGLSNPYIIRSHTEDQKGASVQSIMPLGEKVTTIKVSSMNKAFSIHTGKTVANVNDEKACRTKLAAEVDAEKILDNYHSEIFGWHRVTFYGNYRKEMINLATLYGLKTYQEDK